ncbi:unnamed protein product [Schistosoma mattheei]|uniref:Uncharacterized protein n=1 Tax=Schistosoma mattheei TaxID=31246 RepID=A0AA85BNY4_9TREM|nr:unnamed protein product [Schistosoma mattheei]
MRMIESRLEDSRHKLMETSNNIEKAAAFCSEKYLVVVTLLITLELATQSVCAVAHEVNRFASQFLEALEYQSYQTTDLSDKISKLKMASMQYLLREGVAQGCWVVHSVEGSDCLST